MARKFYVSDFTRKFINLRILEQIKILRILRFEFTKFTSVLKQIKILQILRF